MSHLGLAYAAILVLGGERRWLTATMTSYRPAGLPLAQAAPLVVALLLQAVVLLRAAVLFWPR